MFRPLVLLFLFLASYQSEAQTIGGASVYNFLKLPQHPLVAASGGRTVSGFFNEISLVGENPAFLNHTHSGEISTNMTFFMPGLTIANVQAGYHFEQINTTFALSIHHLSYGTTEQTDAGGNMLGTFRPYDQFIQVSASHAFGKHWNYGGNLKYIISNYGIYSSSALALDMGLKFTDDERLITAGFSARNMGFQLKSYANQGEDLPFDLSIGISKKLERAPFRFSVTAQKVHQFDILYNDTLFNNLNVLQSRKNGFVGKIISHLIASADLDLGDRVVLTLGYNFLKRKELSLQRMSNGLTGFSYGMTLKLKRLKFYFSRAHYQNSLANMHAGITCNLRNN